MTEFLSPSKLCLAQLGIWRYCGPWDNNRLWSDQSKLGPKNGTHDYYQDTQEL